MDHSENLTKRAASIIDDLLGSGMSPEVSYSVDGNSIIMEFHNYPVYRSKKGKTGNVYVVIPASTFKIRNGKVVFERLAQTDCKFYQNRIGEAFAHPHIFSDGHPCWHGGDRSRAVDFICNVVETLSLTNVTNASITIGHRASGSMGHDINNLKDVSKLTSQEVDENSLLNARRQEKRVKDTLCPKGIIYNRRAMESFVSNKWSNSITLYMRTKYKGGQGS